MATKKLLVNFLSDFTTDESLRCTVLRHEWKGPEEYGLDANQVNTLNTFNMKLIFDAARLEVEALGVNLGKKMIEIQGGGPPPIAAMTSMYHGGQIHIRKLDPVSIKVGEPSRITVLGNGFGDAPQILFTSGTKTILGTVAGSSCDVDLYQRIEVDLTLPDTGNWTVQARNDASEAWNTNDIGTLVVNP